MSNQNKYLSKLSDTRVLIIGGSSGIGFGVAEACIEYGAFVTIASSSQSRVNQTLSTLRSSYPSSASKIFGSTIDLSQADTLEDNYKRLFEQIVEQMGGQRLDHVIYTAGDALATQKISDLTMDSIIRAGQLRFFAPLLLAKFLPSFMTQSYKSSYTITSGLISEKPTADWSVVAAYAGGHHAMTRNLALDLKPIRVNCVSPGIVDTDLWRMPREEKDRLLKEVGDKAPTGRPGHAEDIAETYLAILKDANMDGSIVRTDAGSGLV